MPFIQRKSLLILSLFCILILSCKTGAVNLFKSSSPHEQYQRKLTSTGFDKTAAGTAWLNAAQSSLLKSSQITLPFRERGYFAAENIPAVAYQFTATKGQRLHISISQKPVEGFKIYVDLLSLEDQKLKSIAFIDTVKSSIEYDVDDTGKYLVRLQPELLTNGEYTLEINYGPSLAYPIKTSSRNNTQSFFGDGRDANTRKHEGIDMFAPRFTPVIAAAEGTVTRVNENNLGGRVVWMRPNGKDYTLYYAHLDKQIAIEGQKVMPGDTLGLMGNTGNAKTTSPHLHFGIYSSGGAVDPFPFVNPQIKPLPEISASLTPLNATMRTVRNADIFSSPDEAGTKLRSVALNSIVKVHAANRNWYRVELPDQMMGFIQSSRLVAISKPIKAYKISVNEQIVFDMPDTSAAIKTIIPVNSSVELLGYSGKYALIKGLADITGWIMLP